MQSVKTVDIELEQLHKAQQSIIDGAARFNVACCGRRFGKDILAKHLYILPALEGKRCAWFNPSYPMLTDTWRDVMNTVAEIVARPNVQQHSLELVTGGILDMWSMDAINSARGRKYHRIIVNECAFTPTLMDAWDMVMRPMLMDFQGDAYFFSTPKGRGGFYQLYQYGIDGTLPDWKSFHFPTWANPHIKQAEVDEARARMSYRAFRQEIAAEFMDDAGGVFRNVRAAATAPKVDGPQANHTYVAGLDWALSTDYTVLTVCDATTKQHVFTSRFNGLDYNLQRQRIANDCKRWNVSALIAEANAMGKPNNDELRRLGVPVRDFTTTNTTKAEIIERLAAAFDNAGVQIQNEPVLIGELEAYEQERLTSGAMRYSAPNGMHDDCVMSLALAWSGVGGSKGIWL